MEDNDFLTQIDMGYIGLTKPRVVKSYDKGFDMFEGSDNMPNDPEQAWDDDGFERNN